MTDISFAELVEGLMKQHGTERTAAERLARKRLGIKESEPRVKLVMANLSVERNGVVDRAQSYISVSIGNPAIARRENDRLELTLLFAPRTKKNSKEHYARQSLGYRKYCNAIVKHVKSLAQDLMLPLPDRPYNCTAHFYTDNDIADTVGLMQGLADALENAGAISNDRLIRTWDGTSQTLDKDHPRVVLSLTPK
jgi:hypothetical protein